MQICLFIDFIIMSKDKSEMNVLYLEHSIKTVGNRGHEQHGWIGKCKKY